MSDQRVIEALQQGGYSWKDYFLFDLPTGSSVICTWKPSALWVLNLEDEALHRETVAFLESRGARRFSSSEQVQEAFDWDGIVRIECENDNDM